VNEALAVGLAVLALPIAFVCGYLGVLAALSRPTAPPAPPTPHHRFDVIVPAHNESVGIAQTVASLLAIDYPAELRRVVVIADNCSDDTAEKARAAGATVLERTDTERRGKGYALATAFEWSLADPFKADACCVVDADTLVTKNLLSAFSARLEHGATAMQAHYGVANPMASWRTRLMRIALAMFHQVRSTGRERLGVSCGLRGNGMCFSTALLREVPHDAFSLVEDLEYGIRIGKRGHRVVWVGEADVLGEMVSGEKASRSQRTRWEHGRAQMARLHGWPLLRESIARRDGLLFDLAMDVLVPPLSRIGASVVLGLGVTFALAVVFPSRWVLLPGGLFAFSAFDLSRYVFAGWRHSKTGARGLLDLALAPAYVAWKVMLAFRGKASQKPQTWVRTTREGEPK
jgi:cellulose synthase/poly-beta-1,6-N-acetylglucosamine synthase-like glycosyltransferase